MDSPACYHGFAMIDEKQHLEPPADDANRVTYEFDLSTGELRWSDSLRTLFGHDGSTPTNTHEWWANQVHPEDAMALNETMDMLMYPWVKGWTVDYRFEKADHSFVLVHDRAEVTRDESGKAVRLSGIIWLA